MPDKPVSLISQEASIVEVNGGQITVECVTQSACAQCSQQDNCGNGSIAKAFPKRSSRIVIEQKGSFEPGQNVELLLPAKALLQSAAIVYFLPLFALVLGAFVGDILGQNFRVGEWLSILVALIFALLSGICIRHFGKRSGLLPTLKARSASD